MRCGTPGCYGQGTWKVTDKRDPKLTNVVLVVCVNCALVAGKLGSTIHRIGGET